MEDSEQMVIAGAVILAIVLGVNGFNHVFHPCLEYKTEMVNQSPTYMTSGGFIFPVDDGGTRLKKRCVRYL